jgi:hypothetical protein
VGTHGPRRCDTSRLGRLRRPALVV